MNEAAAVEKRWRDHMRYTPLDRKMFDTLVAVEDLRLRYAVDEGMISIDNLVEDTLGVDLLLWEEVRGVLDRMGVDPGASVLSEGAYAKAAYVSTPAKYGPGVRPDFSTKDLLSFSLIKDRAQYEGELAFHLRYQKFANRNLTAKQRRETVGGVAYINHDLSLGLTNDLPVVRGRLLNDLGEGQIPGQVAARLEGRYFPNFKDFRKISG